MVGMDETLEELLVQMPAARGHLARLKHARGQVEKWPNSKRAAEYLEQMGVIAQDACDKITKLLDAMPWEES